MSSLAVADPPPGGVPPPANCGKREPLTKGTISDGRYVGLERIKGFSVDDPEVRGGKWFHEVTIMIADGKASLRAIPVVFVRGERHESASEGGFHRSEGCLKAQADHYSVEMRLMGCEYGCPPPTKMLSIKPMGADVSVNGKRYRRAIDGPRRQALRRAC